MMYRRGTQLDKNMIHPFVYICHEAAPIDICIDFAVL